jgi:phospholipase/lecithinase/hemolysin
MKKRLGKLSMMVMAAGLMLIMASGTGLAKNPKNVVFVIGDSLSDPGNLYEFTGFWPPSPPYAERNSNGPVWTEYFSADMGVPVDSRAFGGAFSGVLTPYGFPVSNLNDLQYPGLFPLPPGLPGVSEEIDTLLDEFPEGLNPHALYVVWVGANDFFLGLSQPENLGTILETTAGNIAESVCRLGTAGARHFAIGNMPDIGVTPFAREQGPEAQALISQTIAQFNAALTQVLMNLPSACAETIEVLDSYQVLHDIIDDPTAYGLTDVTESCLTPTTVCTNPNDYLFWDSVHPTTVGQKIFAEKFRSAFCGTDELNPGLRGRPTGMPPAGWRGVCYGTK